MRKNMREKEAAPLTLGGLAAGTALGHLAANAGITAHNAFKRGRGGNRIVRRFRKYLHKTDRKNLTRGILDGVANNPERPLHRLKKIVAGPELGAGEDLGRALGSQLQGMGRRDQADYLVRVSKFIRSNPELNELPYAKQLSRAAASASKKIRDGGIRKKTYGPVARNAPVAASVALGAAHPGSAGHMVGNKLRNLAARSTTGREVAIDKFLRGVRGAKPSKATALAESLLVSPALDEPRHVAEALKKVVQRNPQRAASQLAELSSISRPGSVLREARSALPGGATGKDFYRSTQLNNARREALTKKIDRKFFGERGSMERLQNLRAPTYRDPAPSRAAEYAQRARARAEAKARRELELENVDSAFFSRGGMSAVRTGLRKPSQEAVEYRARKNMAQGINSRAEAAKSVLGNLFGG